MRYLFAVLMLTVLIPPRVTAQDRTVIARGKAASAMVELDDGKTAATAFCIHKSGIFVTNHHVVAKTKPGAGIRLILDVATPAQRQVLATVIRSDAENDLALLRTTEPGEFEALNRETAITSLKQCRPSFLVFHSEKYWHSRKTLCRRSA